MPKPLLPEDGEGWIRLDGLRAELRAAEAAKVKRGDPRVGGDWSSDLSSVERHEANEASPVIRQARRRIDQIDAGVPIITSCPQPKRWPVLAQIPEVVNHSVRRTFVDEHDNVAPIFTPRHTPPNDPDAEAEEMIARRAEALADELAQIFAELDLPQREVCWL